jgi:hypothetical protein
MRISLSRVRSRRLIFGIALAAIALRALIPAGFMPAPDRPFSLEPCPDGMSEDAGIAMHEHPAGLDHVPAHGGSRPHPNGHVEHCVFGGAASPAPAPHVAALGLVETVLLLSAAAFGPQWTGALLIHAPLPRGPPTLR